MNLTEYAIKNRAVTYFFLVLLLLGGIGSYFVLGQLEDPVFTVKTGAVVTPYPGASAYEVELEVTDLIEKAIQEMPQLKHLYSFSRPGVSIIKVDIEQKYWADQLPSFPPVQASRPWWTISPSSMALSWDLPVTVSATRNWRIGQMP